MKPGRYFSYLFVWFTIAGAFLFPQRASCQAVPPSGFINYTEDVLRINSPLDEYLAYVRHDGKRENYSGAEYPKPYSKELIRKLKIRTIEFQARRKDINESTLSTNLNADTTAPSLKFSYTYNSNGDLLLYEEFRLNPEKGTSERISQLTKTYDGSGQLKAWRWIAPPIDSFERYHFNALFTPVQEHYGPYRARGWVERDDKGREVASIFVQIEPKYDKLNFERRSLFKGSETRYMIRKSQYNKKGQPILESTSQSFTDSAALFKDKKPIHFTSYHYSFTGRLKKKIVTSRYQALDKYSSWKIMLFDFAAIGKKRVTKIDTYWKEYASKSPSGIYQLLKKAPKLVPKYWGKNLISQIIGKPEKVKTERFQYTWNAKLKTYKVNNGEPDLIITRSYPGRWVIEKSVEIDNQYWLIRRYKNNLITHEFFAQGYNQKVSPKAALFFFPRSRKKAESVFYAGNEVSRVTYNYKNKLLDQVTNDYCRCSIFIPSTNRPLPRRDLPPETCFEPFKNRLQLNRYKALFSRNKKSEAAFIESQAKRGEFRLKYSIYSGGERQQLSDYSITTF